MSLVSLKYAIAICEHLEKICASKPTISNDDVTGGYIPDGSRLYVDDSGIDYGDLEAIYHDVGNLDDLARELENTIEIEYLRSCMEIKVTKELMTITWLHCVHPIEISFVEGTYVGIKNISDDQGGGKDCWVVICDLYDFKEKIEMLSS